MPWRSVVSVVTSWPSCLMLLPRPRRSAAVNAAGVDPRRLWLPARRRDRIGAMKNPSRLGVGFIGSGFNAKFHMQAWQQVRDADVRGVWSPNAKNAGAAAAY